MQSLSLLCDEVRAGTETQERRADALDSKAGVLLGFAGVIVTLGLANLHGILAEIAAGVAGAAAFFAASAFIPRKTPVLSLRRLRDGYLSADEEYTRLRILDTRILMYQRTETALRAKAQRVNLSTALLALAVIFAVIGSIVTG